MPKATSYLLFRYHLLVVKQYYSRLDIWFDLVLTVDALVILPRNWL